MESRENKSKEKHTIAESGAFLGRSTVFISQGIKERGEGIVISIDPHLGIPYYHPEPTYNDFLRIINDNFSQTHKIIRTFHCDARSDGAYDNSCFVIVKKDVYDENIKHFIEYFHKNKNYGYFWSSCHNITFLN